MSSFRGRISLYRLIWHQTHDPPASDSIGISGVHYYAWLTFSFSSQLDLEPSEGVSKWRIAQIKLALGCVCKGISWLMTDVGRRISPWVDPFLGCRGKLAEWPPLNQQAEPLLGFLVSLPSVIKVTWNYKPNQSSPSHTCFLCEVFVTAARRITHVLSNRTSDGYLIFKIHLSLQLMIRAIIDLHNACLAKGMQFSPWWH